MKEKRTTKLFIIFLTLIFSIQFLGCDFAFSLLPAQRPTVADDPTVLNELLNLDFERTFHKNQIDIGHQQFFGGEMPEELSDDQNYYTYLTEHYAPGPGYYLVYMREELINPCIEFLRDYYAQKDSRVTWEFDVDEVDQEHVVDGKYLMAHQKMGGSTEDLLLCRAGNVLQMAFRYEGYQLVYCARSKSVRIDKNLSTGEAIDREHTVYCRKVLEYTNQNNAPTEGSANGDYAEKRYFDYEGLRAEFDPESFEDMTYVSALQSGWSRQDGNHAVHYIRIVNIDGVNYFLMPRYLSYGGWNYTKRDWDYLEPASKSNPHDDIYGEYRTLLKRAFVRELTTMEAFKYEVFFTAKEYAWVYSLFDFDKVCASFLRQE